MKGLRIILSIVLLIALSFIELTVNGEAEAFQKPTNLPIEDYIKRNSLTHKGLTFESPFFPENLQKNIDSKVIKRRSTNTPEWSKEPEDLEPIAGTLWILGFMSEGEDNSVYNWATAIFCASDTDTLEDGTVILPCNDLNYGLQGLARVSWNTDAETSYRVFQFIFPNLLYTITKSGNFVNGNLWSLDPETGEVVSVSSTFGFKWGPPPCDMNNDNKLGVAEAIQYLKMATGK